MNRPPVEAIRESALQAFDQSESTPVQAGIGNLIRILTNPPAKTRLSSRELGIAAGKGILSASKVTVLLGGSADVFTAASGQAFLGSLSDNLDLRWVGGDPRSSEHAYIGAMRPEVFRLRGIFCEAAGTELEKRVLSAQPQRGAWDDAIFLA